MTFSRVPNYPIPIVPWRNGLKLEGKINALLSGDVQDKFDIFADSFDSKLRSLTKRIDNVVQSAAVAEASSPRRRLFSVVVGKRKETTFHFDAHRQMDSFLLLKAVVLVRKKKKK